MTRKKTTRKTKPKPPPTPDGPAIYVASLSDYVSGRLHGWWIDATLGEDYIREQVELMLSASPDPHAEEWAIHDYQGFGSLRLGEYESLETVAKLGELVDEHGELFSELVRHYGIAYIDEAVEALEERHAGEAESLEDWAAEYIEDAGWLKNVPENLRYYFNFEKYANDLEYSGDIFTIEVDGTVHVFWNH